MLQTRMRSELATLSCLVALLFYSCFSGSPTADVIRPGTGVGRSLGCRRRLRSRCGLDAAIFASWRYFRKTMLM